MNHVDVVKHSTKKDNYSCQSCGTVGLLVSSDKTVLLDNFLATPFYYWSASLTSPNVKTLE